MHAKATQAELADRTGLSVRAIAALELGEREHPYAHTLDQLADALDMAGNAFALFCHAARSNGTGSTPDGWPPGILGSEAGPTFVGRRDCLDQLLGALERTETGAGGVVMLGGGPGTGKTRLAHVFAREALARGFDVGTGTAYEYERGVSLEPLADALRGIIGDPGDDSVRTRNSSWPQVNGLLGIQRATALPGGNHLDASLSLPHQIALSLIEWSKKRPILLIFDNVQAADEELLETIHFLSRRVPQMPVLLLIGYRDTEAQYGRSFNQFTIELARVSAADVVRLESLDLAETAAIVADILDGPPSAALANRIHDLSLGNPLFVIRLTKAMRDEGMAYPWGPGWHGSKLDALPDLTGVREIIGKQVAGLGTPSNTALAVISVAGPDASLDVVLNASKLTEEELAYGLDAAISAGIIQLRDGIFEFQHPLYRESVRQNIPSVRRLMLERFLARARELHETPQEEPRAKPMSA